MNGADNKGMEGGADEELDFDENEAFQDDDDVNTFYHNQEDEEEAKLQDVSCCVCAQTVVRFRC